MTESFEVKWEVDDGYAGGSRPQSFEIDAADLEGWDAEDFGELFDQMLSDEFRHNIHYYSADKDAFIEWASAQVEDSQ